MPMAIVGAFCIALVPKISSLIAKNNIEEAKKKLTVSFFATILIIIPFAVRISSN
ncbi:MAG: hypothetical protein FWC79_02120 [Oscillospiraceae bacterium]|nr:hypothetical protein [Oscillospiraceae bacterium]